MSYTNCGVCQHRLSKNLVATKCGHVYHETCMTVWFESSGGEYRVDLYFVFLLDTKIVHNLLTHLSTGCPSCETPLTPFELIRLSTEHDERNYHAQSPHHSQYLNVPQTLPNFGSIVESSFLTCTIADLLTQRQQIRHSKFQRSSSQQDELQDRLEELENECSKLNLDLKFEQFERVRLERELAVERECKNNLENERNILLEINNQIQRKLQRLGQRRENSRGSSSERRISSLGRDERRGSSNEGRRRSSLGREERREKGDEKRSWFARGSVEEVIDKKRMFERARSRNTNSESSMSITTDLFPELDSEDERSPPPRARCKSERGHKSASLNKSASLKGACSLKKSNTFSLRKYW